MNVAVNFVCDGSANNGKIQLVVDFVDPGVPYVGDFLIYWGVTDPNGVVLKQYDGPDTFPNPLWDGHYVDSLAHSTDELLLDIPLGSDGNYVLGDYIFNFYIKDSELGNDPGAEYESGATWQFNFQTTVENTTTFGDAQLTAEFNCATAEITATDSTSLDGFTLVERVLRLTPPNVPGYPAPVSVDTDQTVLTETFAWNNAYYQVSLSVTRSYEQDDSDGSNNVTTTVLEMLVAQTTLHIVCGTGMCDAAACLADQITTLEDLACDHGSWGKIPQSDMNKALKKVFYGLAALLYKECGNYNQSAVYAATAGDCDCGCSDTATDTSEITPYTAP